MKYVIDDIESYLYTKFVVTKGSIRRKSKEIFQKVITLRKKGHSYTEIRKETGIAKSTINNWLTFAGLTLGQEHFQIQTRKRLENHTLGTEAAKITRARRKEEDISKFILEKKKFFTDPFFVAGIMLYEAEGSKGENNGFSNSNFKLVKTYINFLEKYILLDRNTDLDFWVYIHDSRKDDLKRITNFWAQKLSIKPIKISISWKHNIVSKKRFNLDYVGQLNVRVRGFKYFTRKILSISDIMLTVFQRNIVGSSGAKRKA